MLISEDKPWCWRLGSFFKNASCGLIILCAWVPLINLWWLYIFLEVEGYKRKVEGGAMQITLHKVHLDFYPFHAAGKSDCSCWHCTLFCLGSRTQFHLIWRISLNRLWTEAENDHTSHHRQSRCILCKSHRPTVCNEHPLICRFWSISLDLPWWKHVGAAQLGPRFTQRLQGGSA